MSKRIEDLIRENQKKMRVGTEIRDNSVYEQIQEMWREFAQYSVFSQNPRQYGDFAQSLGDYILDRYNLSRDDFEHNLRIYEDTQRVIDSKIKGYDEN